MAAVLSSLDQESDSKLDIHAPLMEMGLDSLATTQLTRQLSTDLGLQLSATLVFDYPTMKALCDHLVSELCPDGLNRDIRLKSFGRPRAVQGSLSDACRDLAISGMSCRVPGGIEGPTMLWDTVAAGKCTVGKVPFSRWDVDALLASNPAWGHEVQNRNRWGGFLTDLELFDASLFRISAAEANVMDPQQRLILENTYLAFGDAGYSQEDLSGTTCGVFVGIESFDVSRFQRVTTAYSGTGAAQAYAAGRVSFVFGLQGPCSTFNAACASFAVALHSAARCVQAGDCDLAVVASAKANLEPSWHVGSAIVGTTSATGRCHSFDAAADGYVRSEGCGAVVVKRMVDAISNQDHVHAAIRGVSAAQDGASASLTAPNGKAQERSLCAALNDGAASGRDLCYVEAHGTATLLGDPIEVGAVANVLGEGRDEGQPLVITSMKANIGHMECAAGAGSFIKAVQVLKHEQAPANILLKSLNPKIATVVKGSAVRFPISLEQLEGLRDTTPGSCPRFVCALSSYGANGSISHVILEQAPRELSRKPEQLAHVGTKETCNSFLFLFTGQGSQYEGYGAGPLREPKPVFRDALDQCAAAFDHATGSSLLEVMYPSNEESVANKGLPLTEPCLDQTQYAQPALFALEWALARAVAVSRCGAERRRGAQRGRNRGRLRRRES